MKNQCRSRPSGHRDPSSSGSQNKYKGRWCENCRSRTHDTSYCRKKNTAKVVSDKTEKVSNHFAFQLSNNEIENDDSAYKLLVDCGATCHIITDKNKFVNVDKNFKSEKHFIELADGTRLNNIVLTKGDAHVNIKDSDGQSHKMILKNALCIPSFK